MSLRAEFAEALLSSMVWDGRWEELSGLLPEDMAAGECRFHSDGLPDELQRRSRICGVSNPIAEGSAQPKVVANPTINVIAQSTL